MQIHHFSANSPSLQFTKSITKMKTNHQNYQLVVIFALCNQYISIYFGKHYLHLLVVGFLCLLFGHGIAFVSSNKLRFELDKKQKT